MANSPINAADQNPQTPSAPLGAKVLRPEIPFRELKDLFAQLGPDNEANIKELSKRLVLENMLKKLSTKAIELGDVQQFLNESLMIMGQTMNVGSSFIYEFRKSEQKIGVLAEWYPETVPPYEIDLTSLPVQTLEWSLGQLMQGEIINIADVADMPEGAEKEIAKVLGTVSALIVPLFIQSEFIGCMGFEDYDKGRSWSDQDIDILRTAAHIISRAIENERLRAQLVESVNQTGEELSKAKGQLEAEIKERKRTIRKLKTKEQELALQNSRLEEMNSALSVLVQKRNEDVERIEGQMAHNIRELIDPTLQRLKQSQLSDAQRKWLEVLEANLGDIASPLVSRLTAGYRKLTPTEIKVAAFIKYGKSNKDISELLNISSRTVEVHRCNIRKKLGLKDRSMNLRTHLLSME